MWQEDNDICHVGNAILKKEICHTYNEKIKVCDGEQ